MSSSTPAFQAILQKFAAEAESVWSELRAQTRNELAAQLNQSVRRIRQSATREQLGGIVADTASTFASSAAWLRIEGESARAEELDVTVPLSEAAALNEAVRTCEPVVAMASASEVSATLANTPENRALIYPVVAGGKAVALLYASANPKSPAPNAALELLTQVASSAWQALEPPRAPAPALIAIAPAAKPAEPWEALNPAEQQTHLRAQRYARVQVAEMRLRHAAAVQSGRLRGNLYLWLREPIDAARNAYRNEFFNGCSNMIDYLHLELIRTLAHDDADLLGKDYPGPLL